MIAVVVAGAPLAQAQSPGTENAHVGAPQTGSHTDCENDSCRLRVCETDKFDNTVCNTTSYQLPPAPIQLSSGLPDVHSLALKLGDGPENPLSSKPHRLYRSADGQLDRITRAESVDVKYRGEVNLKFFDCTDIARSSFIRRICYDETNEYMLINLNGTYYHYCAIDAGTVSSLLSAPSMGRFYNSSIKGNFDCRTHRVPEYPQGPDANTLAAAPDGARPPPAKPESGPYDGRWSATVGPQGTCNFTSILILDVLGSSIVGNATNPFKLRLHARWSISKIRFVHVGR